MIGWFYKLFYQDQHILKESELESKKHIILITSDKKEVIVHQSELIFFGTLERMATDLSISNDWPCDITLPYNFFIVSKILEWIRTCEKTKERKDDLFGKVFDDIDISNILQIIEACQYLNISSLEFRLSKYVASKIKIMNSFELRENLGKQNLNSSLSTEEKTKINELRKCIIGSKLI